MEMEALHQAYDFNLAPFNPDVTVAEYIWIGGTGNDLRSKTMVIHKKINSIEDLPFWNFDGSSTKQATTQSSEVILKPVWKCPDPFRIKSLPNAVLVLCESLETDYKTPAIANFRHMANLIMEQSKDQKPWFGFEQEYILLRPEGTHAEPLGFPKHGYARPQGDYYCGLGASAAIGRVIAESHMKACLAANITVSGLNAEVFPGQWEFQVGPVEGIHGCDQLWMSRYILKRVAEDYGVDVTFEPKPVQGDWNGTGMHTNFSTTLTRAEGGLDKIISYMERLSKKHTDHIKLYGTNNHLRLTGQHETASMKSFSYDIAHRGCSVRIPSTTAASKMGYFEDRRPAGNSDPYLVGGMLVDTVCNDGAMGDKLVGHYDAFINPIEERVQENITKTKGTAWSHGPIH
jgi:glutamine synthetase